MIGLWGLRVLSDVACGLHVGSKLDIVPGAARAIGLRGIARKMTRDDKRIQTNTMNNQWIQNTNEDKRNESVEDLLRIVECRAKLRYKSFSFANRRDQHAFCNDLQFKLRQSHELFAIDFAIDHWSFAWVCRICPEMIGIIKSCMMRCHMRLVGVRELQSDGNGGVKAVPIRRSQQWRHAHSYSHSCSQNYWQC